MRLSCSSVAWGETNRLGASRRQSQSRARARAPSVDHCSGWTTRTPSLSLPADGGALFLRSEQQRSGTFRQAHTYTDTRTTHREREQRETADARRRARRLPSWVLLSSSFSPQSSLTRSQPIHTIQSLRRSFLSLSSAFFPRLSLPARFEAFTMF